MNWFKAAKIHELKLAFPIQEKERRDYYSYFLHPDEEHEKEEHKNTGIWVILNNGTFHSAKLEEVEEHAYWSKWNYQNMAASGRYMIEPTGTVVSLVLKTTDLNYYRTRALRKRIEKILDKEFDNPKIIEYK